MGFLHKVEADIRTFKSKKIEKNSSNKKIKDAEVKGEEVGFSDLTNTRKLTGFIHKELQLTDPFNFTNDTWARFIKRIVPKLLTALLLDMKIVPKTKKAEFARYLERRLRSLTQT